MKKIALDLNDYADDLNSKFLTFSLTNEEYGIGIMKIKEIIGMMPITKVPQTPDFVKGVINLRGKVIPVIDLRLRFQLDAMDYTDRTCIIVVEVEIEKGILTMGLVVDSVSEVLPINNKDIEKAPSFGTKVNTTYILGIAKSEKRVMILLDIDKILSMEEMETLQEHA